MKRFDALIKTEKTPALCKIPFLKKSVKYAKNDNFFKNANFLWFFLIFSEIGLCKKLRFFALWSVHQNALFKLSNSPLAGFLFFGIQCRVKTQFWDFLKIFSFLSYKLHLKHLGIKSSPKLEKKGEKGPPPILRYRLNVFLTPLPEVGCPIFLEIWNPWGKVMERSGLRFEHCCVQVV